MLMAAKLDETIPPLVQLAPEHDDGKRHFVVHTEPNGELRAFRWLSYRGVSTYLPQFRRTHTIRRRQRIMVKSMFPGYCFIRTYPDASFRDVEATPGVLNVLRIDGRPAWLPDAAIAAIRTKEAELANPTRPVRYDFKGRVGQQVRLEEGPFQGYYATIAGINDLDSKGRIKVAIDIFRRLTPIEVSVDQVRLV